jgi:hypothetical protein
MAVGDVEPCDWCGHAGRVIEYSAWRDDVLVFRDPALCAVWSMLLLAPGEVVEAFDDAGLNYDRTMEAFDLSTS